MNNNELAVKPKTVTTAIYLLWFSFVASLPLLLIALKGSLADSPTPTIVALIGVLTLQLWLNIKISVGRNWARITFAVLCFLNLPLLPHTIQTTFHSPLGGSLNLFMMILDFLILYLLFIRTSKSWFNQNRLKTKNVKFSKILLYIVAMSLLSIFSIVLLSNLSKDSLIKIANDMPTLICQNVKNQIKSNPKTQDLWYQRCMIVIQPIFNDCKNEFTPLLPPKVNSAKGMFWIGKITMCMKKKLPKEYNWKE